MAGRELIKFRSDKSTSMYVCRRIGIGMRLDLLQIVKLPPHCHFQRSAVDFDAE